MKNPDNLPLVIPHISEDIYKQMAEHMKKLQDKYKPRVIVRGNRVITLADAMNQCADELIVKNNSQDLVLKVSKNRTNQPDSQRYRIDPQSNFTL